jgi:hypothetical protein
MLGCLKITKDGGTMHTSRTGTATVTERPSRSHSTGILFAQAIPTPPHPTSSTHFPKSHQPSSHPIHPTIARRRDGSARQLDGIARRGMGRRRAGRGHKFPEKQPKTTFSPLPRPFPPATIFFHSQKRQNHPPPPPPLQRESGVSALLCGAFVAPAGRPASGRLSKTR